ncbi:hypothetical protein ACQCSV_13515 [Pseudarthrobacter sp. S3]|uniref:hypothetical protein n=1 Tax=Pseudarthrobacter sp. S3 TaxID=3418419 RepID=UPI003CF0A99D
MTQTLLQKLQKQMASQKRIEEIGRISRRTRAMFKQSEQLGSVVMLDARTGERRYVPVQAALLDEHSLAALIRETIADHQRPATEVADLMIIKTLIYTEKHPDAIKDFKAEASHRRVLNERAALESQAAKDGAPALAEGVL